MDVTELRDFYATPLGATVRRLLRDQIRARWTRVHGEVVIGLGFATPYLSAFRAEAAVVGALMPAVQGVLAWPAEGPRQAALVEEDALPLSDSSVDRVLMVHSLELAEQARALLREVWRVLKPEGRLLVIVPNRRGPWARFDTTPFGYGLPYSRGQLERLLSETMLGPVGWCGALIMPPVDSRLLRRYAEALERNGSRYWPAFAGVNLVEARKELVAPVAVSRRLSAVRQLRPFRASPAMPTAARKAEELATCLRRDGRQQPGLERPDLVFVKPQAVSQIQPQGQSSRAVSAGTQPACRPCS
jgi:SAM-dependent methyltransferase